MQTCARNIICFLTENGYDQPISPKILSSPSSKDFQNMFIFLVRQLDPSFEFVSRFEDEVPALLKLYGYPYSIPRSSLQAVGSPHTWPALLASLTWLLELVKYDKEVALKRAERESVDLDPVAEGARIFFDYVRDTYDIFMGGDDDFGMLDRDLAAKFEIRDKGVRSEIESLEKRIASLEEELEEAEKEEDPRIALKRKKEELTNNVDKFNQLIEQLKSHEGRLSLKLSEKEAAASSLESSLSKLAGDKESLQETLAVQESNAIDAQRIQRDRATLRSKLSHLSAKRKDAEAEQVAEEAQVIENTRELDESLLRYHELAESLGIIPTTAPHSGGVDVCLTLTRDQSVTDPGTMLSKDVESEVEPVVRRRKESLSATIKERRAELLELERQLNAVEQDLLIKTDEYSVLKLSLGRKQAEYKSTLDALSRRLQANTDRTAALDAEIQSLRDGDNSRLREAEEAAENARAELAEVKRRCEAEADVRNKLCLSIGELVVSYKKNVSDVMCSIERELDKKLLALEQREELL
eukprot:Plantae.Rhodophyta-Rhodochaete_pulchella.ctg3720.p1 GENE.Plantae.Rhodophyta-Rhodochaete_pulchella.ctg3720~~Plantae.Rhodophyta-Rhodochaete_pulchella.ctg3720.p1  ORF type:complete len:526 (+),score=126.61 Plantae.Rhodophyta-Rhodochaete_pulchella.ctg3720:309-1886(+)